MANEIRLAHPTASKTDLYAVIRNDATLKVWDGTGLVTWADADIDNYDIPLTYQSGDLYTADAPANLIDGAYKIYFYDRVAAAPATDDNLITSVAFEHNTSGTATTTPVGSVAGLDKLGAVNEMLLSIRRFPVISLDTGGASDAAIAEAKLDTADRKIQSEGWHCNTEYNVILTVDGDNKIPLGTNIMKVDVDPEESDSGRDVCRRGNFLYDLENQTDQFTGTLTVERVLQIPFQDLTPVLKDLVTAEATVEFQRAMLGSSKIDTYTRDNLLASREAAGREENDNGDYNTLSRRSAREIIGHRGTVSSR